MDTPLLTWWAVLLSVSTLNVLAWLATLTRLRQLRPTLPPEVWTTLRWQLMLSAGYVFGCAWRSLFPVYDVPRLALVDSWLASAAVGRTVATIAELCFAAQWALLLRDASRATGSAFGTVAARVLVPLIAVAETFSWHAVLTTSNAGHVVEESLWALCAALVVASLAMACVRSRRANQPALVAACVLGTAYLVYMLGVDVPMYWARWMSEAPRGHHALGIAEGFVDAVSRRLVSHRWADWRSEVMWMTIYFSVGVWVSIALIRSPLRFAAPRATPALPSPHGAPSRSGRPVSPAG